MRREFRDKSPGYLIHYHKFTDTDGGDFFHLFSRGSAWSYFYVLLKRLIDLYFFPFLAFLSFAGILHFFQTSIMYSQTITESALSYSKISDCRKSTKLQGKGLPSLALHFCALKSQVKQIHNSMTIISKSQGQS